MWYSSERKIFIFYSDPDVKYNIEGFSVYFSFPVNSLNNTQVELMVRMKDNEKNIG